MLKSEISMFRYTESKLFGGVLDVEGIKEEFEKIEFDYVTKLINDIEKRKEEY